MEPNLPSTVRLPAKFGLSESEERLKVFKKKLWFEGHRGAYRIKTKKQLLEIAEGRSRPKLHYVTMKARMLGLLVPGPCEVCGMEPNKPMRVGGHHDDYNFPLSVRWLCLVHHAEWHGSNEPLPFRQEFMLLTADESIELGKIQLGLDSR